jgi:hypothetical protein
MRSVPWCALLGGVGPIKVITENIRTIAAGSMKDLEQIAQTLLR